MLYNFIFTEFPFKMVSGEVNAFHRILDGASVTRVTEMYLAVCQTTTVQI